MPSVDHAARPAAVGARARLAGVDLNQPLNALGTEPFWGLEIRPDMLHLAGEDRDDSYAPNPGPDLTVGRAVWTSETDDEVSFQVTLIAKTCSDGISDRKYPLTAQVDVGGEVLEGCAASSTFITGKPPAAGRKP